MKNSVLKRVMSYLLIWVMLLMSFSTVAFASSEVVPVLSLNCNFEACEPSETFGSTNKCGWYSFEQADMGDIANDTENGKVLHFNIAKNSGGSCNVNVGENALSGGKVYVSFSYKYALPEGATASGGSTMLFLQNQVNISATKMYSANWTTEAASTGKDKSTLLKEHAFYFGGLGSKLTVRNICSASNGNCETINVLLNDGKWHEIGYEFDLNNRTLKATVDDTSSGTYTFPTEFCEGLSASLGTIGLRGTVGNYFGSFDNFVVKHIPASATYILDTTVTKDEIAKTIDIGFDEPISPTTLEAIKTHIGENGIRLCGSDETVNVSSVTKANSKIRITYTGDLKAGREYYIPMPQNQTTIYGTSLDEAVFVNAEYTQKVTTVLDTCTFETGSGSESLDSSWYSSSYVPTIIATPAGTTGNTSSYVLAPPANKWAFQFGKVLAEYNGKNVFEADFCSNVITYMCGNVKLPLSSTNNVWKKLKVIIDYVSDEYSLYVDDTLVYTKTASTLSVSGGFSSNSSYKRLYFGGVALNNGSNNLYIDNFRQTFEVSEPTVTSVRYVDFKDNRFGTNSIKPEIKAINVKFTEAMDTDTLADITVQNASITGRSYDEETFTYTLACANGLSANSNYTLTIPNTVKSAAGVALSEAITYSFATVEGSFAVTELKLILDGSELTNEAVATLAQKEITVSADISNSESISGNATLIFAAYDADGNLLDAQYSGLKAYPEGTDSITHAFTVKSGITPAKAKAFIWKGALTDLMPLKGSQEYGN